MRDADAERKNLFELNTITRKGCSSYSIRRISLQRLTEAVWRQRGVVLIGRYALSRGSTPLTASYRRAAYIGVVMND